MPPCIIVILFVFESHVVDCVNLRKEIKLKLKLVKPSIHDPKGQPTYINAKEIYCANN